MEDRWSTIASIVYFTLYTTMMGLLASWIWKKEKHKLDRTFLKTIWIQRRIYGQVIVHFYDTATDVSVLITWYSLYYDEKIRGLNYERVNMAVFFWSGCSVLIFYRLVTFVVIWYKLNETADDVIGMLIGVIIRIPLAILDLFILEGIHDSFKSSTQIREDNRKKAEKKRARIELQKAKKLEEKKKKKIKLQEAKKLEEK
eukprot:332489_1